MHVLSGYTLSSYHMVWVALLSGYALSSYHMVWVALLSGYALSSYHMVWVALLSGYALFMVSMWPGCSLLLRLHTFLFLLFDPGVPLCSGCALVFRSM